MKKRGILNAELSRCVAALGHKDLFMIGDAGMPIPEGVTVIDLAVCGGVPKFEQVLAAVLEEAEVEYYFLASEIQDKNAGLHDTIKHALPNVPSEMMAHDELKQKSKACKFAVRTGEFSSYANVILQAGVVF